MPLREMGREQIWMLPPTLDELLPLDHPARFVAEFVDALGRDGWSELGVEIGGDPLGAPAYHPRALLSVWLYGFMTGVRSCRKLEAACRDQISYLWLTGWQHPDHNTLWRFYKGHRQAMRTLFERTVRTAVTMKLVDLAVQAVDGTKVVANASLNRSYDAKGLRGLLDRVERAIGDLEAENEAGEDTAAAHLPEELADKEVLRAQVRQAMTDLASQERHKRINLTDRDARLMKGRQGIVAGYNAQAMVSPTEPAGGATGMLVTAVDVVDEANDNAMLAPKRRPGRKRRRRWPTPDISPGVTWKNVPAAVSRWWCPSHGSGSSKTHITRTSSPMTSRATALRAHRDRRSTLFVSSMRMESRCVCTGPLVPSVRRVQPSECVRGPERLAEAWRRPARCGAAPSSRLDGHLSS